MRVFVNGQSEEVTGGTTVAELVGQRATSVDGVAVAVNDAVVTRGEWASVVLTDGDRVEILTAVQGG